MMPSISKFLGREEKDDEASDEKGEVDEVEAARSEV